MYTSDFLFLNSSYFSIKEKKNVGTMDMFVPPILLLTEACCLYLFPGQPACPKEDDRGMGPQQDWKKSHRQITCSFFMSIFFHQPIARMVCWLHYVPMGEQCITYEKWKAILEEYILALCLCHRHEEFWLNKITYRKLTGFCLQSQREKRPSWQAEQFQSSVHFKEKRMDYWEKSFSNHSQGPIIWQSASHGE